VLANARREFLAIFGSEFFRVVEADDSPPGIEDDGGSYDRAEERAATHFIESRDTLPAALPREPFVPRTAESWHRWRILSQAIADAAMGRAKIS
jgi:hypothetical protein